MEENLFIENLIEDLIKIKKGELPGKKRKELEETINFRLFQMLNLSLYQTALTASSILRLSGEKLAQQLVVEPIKNDLSLLLEDLKKIFETLSLGKAEIEIIPKQKIVYFNIKENATVAGIEKSTFPLCAFLEGFIEGYLKETLFKKEYLTLISGEKFYNLKVEEIECSGQGKGQCKFLIYFQ